MTTRFVSLIFYDAIYHLQNIHDYRNHKSIKKRSENQMPLSGNCCDIWVPWWSWYIHGRIFYFFLFFCLGLWISKGIQFYTQSMCWNTVCLRVLLVHASKYIPPWFFMPPSPWKSELILQNTKHKFPGIWFSHKYRVASICKLRILQWIFIACTIFTGT